MTGRSGLYIALDGVEGSGKTTQARLLADWLDTCGVPNVRTREPGGTPAGEEIRRILLDAGPITDRAELLLMLAARALILDQVVRPALDAGKVVIADRSELSTLAYQGYGRGLPLDEIRRLNQFATRGLSPHLTIVLDVPSATGEARRLRMGREADRIEREGEAFHARVAEGYRALAEGNPGVERLDGRGSIEAVHEEVKRRIRERFPETFAAWTG